MASKAKKGAEVKKTYQIQPSTKDKFRPQVSLSFILIVPNRKRKKLSKESSMPS
jgi:hypothetical protein